jgi:hypothetical protein
MPLGGPRTPAQPRPWIKHRALISNADVLEIIAEYACGTVKDACALRAANKGYRRAVDTTVRRLVYIDAPLLRDRAACDASLCTAAPHVLPVNPCRQLSTCRIALTGDPFTAIARLVVVAFALDGAKDELHEADECGPRPVADPFVTLCLVMPSTAKGRKLAAPLSDLHSAPVFVHEAVHRCMHDGIVFLAHLPDIPAKATNPWPRLRRLIVSNRIEKKKPAKRDTERLVRLLEAVGPQLIDLRIASVCAEVIAALALCAKLTQIKVDARALDASMSQQLCDAIIVSGAPLVCIDAALMADDALRLLQRVPTITVSHMRKLAPTSIPDAIANRMELAGGRPMRRSPAAIIDPEAGWSPAPHATLVVVTELDPLQQARTDGASFRSAFPALETLFIQAELDATGLGDVLQFSPTLTSLSVQLLVPTTTSDALFTKLAEHQDLSRLAKISIGMFGNSLDVSPLAVFASSLECLVLDKRASRHWADDDLAATEAVLSKLVSLVRVQIPPLPSARCFHGGAHTRLEELVVARANTREAPFAALVEACPRLAKAISVDVRKPFPVPAGWVAREDGINFGVAGGIAVRVSFEVDADSL